MNPSLITSTTSAQTRDRILDAAETLFAQNGFKSTSLRAVTQAADVNLASVNYHFGSKESLILETVSRAVLPINENRLQLLEKAEAENAPNAPSLEKIIEALIRPCIILGQEPKKQNLLKLLGHTLYEEGDFKDKIAEREWKPIAQRFASTLHHTLPQMPPQEIFWKLHFTVGAMIHTCSQHKALNIIFDNQCTNDFESTIKRLVDFSTAGFLSSFNSSFIESEEKK